MNHACADLLLLDWGIHVLKIGILGPSASLIFFFFTPDEKGGVPAPNALNLWLPEISSSLTNLTEAKENASCFKTEANAYMMIRFAVKTSSFLRMGFSSGWHRIL